VKHQERPGQHQDVTQAEYVGAGPGGGDGEDVAEESEICAFDQVRVCERALADVQAGGLESTAARRHHPVIGRDGHQIQKAAHGNHPQEADLAEVHDGAGAYEPVGREVRNAVHVRVAGRDDRYEQDLHGEGDNGQPDAANLQRLQLAQPSSRRGDGEDQQEEGQSECHAWGGKG
jgi:hypothetical protein